MPLPPEVQALADAGFSVVPGDLDKKPRCPWRQWHQERQSAEEREALGHGSVWGLVTGQAHDLVVLDFDGTEGDELLDELGLEPNVITGSGGCHVWVSAPPWPVKTCQKPVPGLDVRGEGGLAWAAGRSRQGDYFQVALTRTPWDRVPRNLLPERLGTQSSAPAGEWHGPGWGTPEALRILRSRCQRLETAPPGTSNGHMNQAAFAVAGLVAAGLLEEDYARTQLRAAASIRGVGAAEAVVAAAWEAGGRSPWVPGDVEIDGEEFAYKAPEAPETKASVKASGAEVPRRRFKKASEIEAQEVDWLWRGWLPKGMVSLMAGDPSAGKTFLALGIAAAVTRGDPLPGDTGAQDPGAVMFVSFEDAPQYTLVPRAERLGADPERLYFTELGDSPTAAEIESLDSEILAVPDLRLVVIDPVGSYIGGATDTGRDAAVREALKPTVELASRHGISVLLLAHLNKGDAKSLYRVTGSIAFVGIARTTLLAGEYQGRRYLAVDKTNLGARPDAVEYLIEDVAGPGSNTGTLVWGAQDPSVRAQDLVGVGARGGPRGQSELDRAKQWLVDALDGGPRPQKELEEEAAQEAISRATLTRAKQELLVVSTRRRGSGSTAAGGWEWSL